MTAELPVVDGGYDVVPFSRIRKRTAEHMVRSKTVSPHALVVMDVDYHGVEVVRRAAGPNFKAETGTSLTYMPFVARAVIDAIADFPRVNAAVADEALLVHRAIHLGVAVDLDFEGLVVPVVHDAGSRSLGDLAREIADLARRARARKLSPDDVQGGTFTLTNLGGYGTVLTSPVINQPQVAIMSTDGVQDRPAVVEQLNGDREIAIRPVGNLALAWDHRAFDGAYAAAFLARVKALLESGDWDAEVDTARGGR